MAKDIRKAESDLDDARRELETGVVSESLSEAGRKHSAEERYAMSRERLKYLLEMRRQLSLPILLSSSRYCELHAKAYGRNPSDEYAMFRISELQKMRPETE